MKINGGVLTGVISAGFVVAGAVTAAFTPAGKKVRKEFVQSVRNVKGKTESVELPSEK